MVLLDEEMRLVEETNAVLGAEEKDEAFTGGEGEGCGAVGGEGDGGAGGDGGCGGSDGEA